MTSHHTSLWSASVIVALLLQLPTSQAADTVKPTADEMAEAQRFVAAKFLPPQATPQKPGLIVAVNNGAIERNSRYNKPLKIVDKQFTRGIAAHATSKIVVQLPGPGKKFSSQIGLDNNEQTASGQGTVVFSLNVAGRNAFRSDVFRVNTPAKPIEVDLKGETQFVLEVGDAGDGIGWDQADWADAQVEPRRWQDRLARRSAHPGRSRRTVLVRPALLVHVQRQAIRRIPATWKVDRNRRSSTTIAPAHTVVYSDPAGGLAVRCEAVEYDDYPTVEWTLHFKNTGAADTPIIENIQSLDIRWQRAHRDANTCCTTTRAAPADNTDYTPLESVLGGNLDQAPRRRRRPLD